MTGIITIGASVSVKVEKVGIIYTSGKKTVDNVDYPIYSAIKKPLFTLGTNARLTLKSVMVSGQNAMTDYFDCGMESTVIEAEDGYLTLNECVFE